jgi:hypothetical protein
MVRVKGDLDEGEYVSEYSILRGFSLTFHSYPHLPA